jgi:hypothetical protein
MVYLFQPRHLREAGAPGEVDIKWCFKRKLKQQMVKTEKPVAWRLRGDDASWD